MISITSEMIRYQSLVINISLYFHCSVFWITSDFSIHLMHFTSEPQTPITFLFVNENIKCDMHFLSQNFAFSAPAFSVGETLHVAYKKYKIKRKFTFSGKYQIYFIS